MTERKATKKPASKRAKEEKVAARTLLVWQGKQEIRVEVPEGCKVTFGPWTPPNARESRYGGGETAGTLRIYQGTSIIGCFTNVREFRDASLEYAKVEFVETGSKVWKKGDGSFEVQEKVNRVKKMVEDEFLALSPGDDDDDDPEF